MKLVTIAFTFLTMFSEKAVCNQEQDPKGTMPANQLSPQSKNQTTAKSSANHSSASKNTDTNSSPSIFSGKWGYLVGANLGLATSGPRAGFDVHLANGRCVDSCGWLTFLVGTDRPWKREYYLGTSIVGIYMGSAFAELDFKFRDRRFNGFRTSAGIGALWYFVYLGLGYEAIERVPSIEIGLSAKMPLSRF